MVAIDWTVNKVATPLFYDYNMITIRKKNIVTNDERAGGFLALCIGFGAEMRPSFAIV